MQDRGKIVWGARNTTRKTGYAAWPIHWVLGIGLTILVLVVLAVVVLSPGSECSEVHAYDSRGNEQPILAHDCH